MRRGRIHRLSGSLRRFATAALRLALAVQLVVLLPFLPFAPWIGLSDAAVLTPFAMAVAAPLLPFHRWIAGRSAPHLRAGYGLVVVYGPVLLVAAIAQGARSEAALWVGFVVYELAAAVVIALYVALWRLGDAWLGEMEHPRVVRRWVFAVVLVVALGLWTPYVAWSWHADTCGDQGGARAGSSCRQ